MAAALKCFIKNSGIVVEDANSRNAWPFTVQAIGWATLEIPAEIEIINKYSRRRPDHPELVFHHEAINAHPLRLIKGADQRKIVG